MVSLLPTECLPQIFENLSEDRKTLHSCLLVNKTWCLNVVKILWSQPFHLINICNHDSETHTCSRTSKQRLIQSFKLISVYLSFLPKSERLILTNNKVKLSTFIEPIYNYIKFLRYLDLEELFVVVGGWKHCLFLSPDQLSYYPPKRRGQPHSSSSGNGGSLASRLKQSDSKKKLVNAVKSVKSLAHGVLRRTKSTNFAQAKENFPVSVERLVSYSLAKLIIRECVNLKSLSINTTITNSIEYQCKCLDQNFIIDRTFNHRNIESIEEASNLRLFRQNVPEEHLLIATYPGANICLPPLVEFVCTTRGSKWRLFHALSLICKQLRKICVDMGGYTNWSPLSVSYTEPQMQELEWESKNLATLIQSQDSLEQFTLLRGEVGLLTILVALKSQINSLRYLELINIDTNLSQRDSIKYINDFSNLHTLKFDSCQLVDIVMRPFVEGRSGLQLSTIEIVDTSVSMEIVTKIIKNANASLRSLILDKNKYDYYESNNGNNIIETTAKYCPNLMDFTSPVATSEIPQLITLFTLCPMLVSVSFVHSFDDHDYMEQQLSDTTNSSSNQEGTSAIDVDWLLEKMSDQKLAQNLRHLSIRAPWSFSPVTLENYLTTCDPPLRSLEFSHFFSDDHLGVILRCLNGKLRNLKLETSDELSDELQVEALTQLENFQVHKLRAESFPAAVDH
ncbi:8570_t:CDS:2 [Acaulospora morrowiae]|uniref:8570_t:CDS:1 n=1 Tax=Acaulospora morrowiae TaxID=94023 RepID=A0A9N8ZM43_9GLOM|nr:8570_t:CDS:2 [Acaulospora morrowiae]